MILAGDLGGTKSLIGLFARGDERRPTPLCVHSIPTAHHATLSSLVQAFLTFDDVRASVDGGAGGRRIDAAAFGVAGPVLGRTATLTHVDFDIDADALSHALDGARVSLLNDLEAMAHALSVLRDSEVSVLQTGTPHDGNLALIAAGTGMNEALVHRVGDRLLPVAAEAGHADWAARTPRDTVVLDDLRARYGRAEVEHVVSGMGVLNIHRVSHRAQACRAGIDLAAPDAAARSSAAALARSCPGCVATFEVFVEAYGAEAGNLALRSMATGGVYIGGGIAPKILPLLADGRFMRAFLDKGGFRALLERMPVKVVLNEQAGLIGAAVAAAAAE